MAAEPVPLTQLRNFWFVTFTAIALATNEWVRCGAVAQRDTINDSSELNVAITSFVESLKIVVYVCDCDSATHDDRIVHARTWNNMKFPNRVRSLSMRWRHRHILDTDLFRRPSKQVSLILCELIRTLDWAIESICLRVTSVNSNTRAP